MQIYFFTKIERKIYMTEEEQKEILASRIREVRMGSGMTTGEYAKALGVSRGAYNVWEKGQISTLKSSIIKKMSQLWNINPMWLIDAECPRKYNFSHEKSALMNAISGKLEQCNEESLRTILRIADAFGREDDGK